MPIPGIPQPERLLLSATLRLRRYDGLIDRALAWYQDEETVWLVDGVRRPYDLDRLEQMYTWLDRHGELYWIEQAGPGGVFRPIGDVTFSQQDLPIVIGERSARGKGIGRQAVAALIGRGRQLGFPFLLVNEIYDWNPASRRLFEGLGFCACEKTEKGSRYRLDLQD